MKYFRAEEDQSAKLPKNFISGFLEVRLPHSSGGETIPLMLHREGIEYRACHLYICKQSERLSPAGIIIRHFQHHHWFPSFELNSSKASVNVSLVASHQSIKSSHPFRRASNADTPESSVNP